MPYKTFFFLCPKKLGFFSFLSFPFSSKSRQEIFRLVDGEGDIIASRAEGKISQATLLQKKRKDGCLSLHSVGRIFFGGGEDLRVLPRLGRREHEP